MKAILFTLIITFLIAGSGVMAQTSEDPEIDIANPVFRQKYENTDFHGNFSVQVLKDKTNNYFLVDFSLLKDKYEKVYFLSLAFQNGKIVNIDSDLKKDKIWFLSHLSNSPEEVNSLLKDIKEKTIEKSKMLSEEQKAQWLLENDKYK
jgi:hypothetical protein